MVMAVMAFMQTPAIHTHHRFLHWSSALAALMAIGAAGCDQEARKAPTEVPSAARARPSAKPQAATTTASPAAAASASPLSAAEPKAYDAPEQAALGTLPDGVGVAVGSTAPDFELPDAQGKPVKLSEVAADAAKGSVLLVFYRGGW